MSLRRLAGSVKRRCARLFQRGEVVYGEEFFGPAWFEGWRVLGPVLRALIETQPHWRAILDYGCGPGALIDPMNDAGWTLVGCDRSREAKALYLEHFGGHPDRYVHDVADVAGRAFDVLMAFDVLEHLTDDEAAALLAATAHIPEVFVNISRTRGIPGHVNIKKDAAWIAFFASQGLDFLPEASETLRRRYRELRPGSPDLWDRNMFVFRRRGAS